MVFISREPLSSNLLNIQKSTKVLDYIQDNWSLIPDYWFGAIWSLSNHLPCSILCSYICYKTAFPAYSKEMLEEGSCLWDHFNSNKIHKRLQILSHTKGWKYRLTCALFYHLFSQNDEHLEQALFCLLSIGLWPCSSSIFHATLPGYLPQQALV